MSHRSYDSWKTTEPDTGGDGADVYADCDCCGKRRPVSRCWAPGGLETWACDECQGIDPADYDTEKDR
jgi:hypothetical protein